MGAKGRRTLDRNEFPAMSVAVHTESRIFS